ncbi:MAG TPA: extracellular solute-binding protein [Spirochaetia bacterium]|nr:extracellular solute-binding protein [Spirochaetia bacterium]
MKKLIIWILSLALLGAVGFASGTKEAQKAAPAPDKLVVLGHKVHRTVSTEGAGGDITQEWLAQTGVKEIEWQTLGNNADITDKLFREASLPTTSLDVGFILNIALTPAVTELFEPLDKYLEKAPIEDLQDIFPGLREAAKFGGVTYAIPFRHATSGLHYNSKDFADRGIGGPPQYIEDFISYIPKLCFTRPDGSQVFGFVIPGKGQIYPNHTDLARAWNGDFITLDYKCKANDYGMIKAVTLLRDLYAKDYYPKAFTAIANVDVNTWMQQGRTAMTFSTTGRNQFYNSPEQSKFPGAFKTIPIPISKELSDKFKVAPAKTEFWCLVIPKNAKHKDLSWDFIRQLSKKQSTLKAALNGNGPVRVSTYEDPVFQKQIPYWEAERDILKVTRVAMPGFDGSAKAADLFNEYAEAAQLGKMGVKEAMDKLTEEVNKLLPK